MGLKQRLKLYLLAVYQKNPNQWVSKGYLEQKAKDIGYLGDNAGRRLRELVEEGVIEHRPLGVSQEYRYSYPHLTS